MENELKTNLNKILEDKNTNLLPENLKTGVTCLGITGTYEGGGSGTDSRIKLFSTVDEMNQSTGNKEGDLAVVYKNTIIPMIVDSVINKIHFDDTITLQEAITDGVYLRLSDGSGNVNVDISLNSTSFDFRYDGYTLDIRVQYTSEDGLVYTKTKGEIDYTLDSNVFVESYEKEMWKDVFGEFIKIPSGDFNGLYTYTLNTPNEQCISLYSLSGLSYDYDKLKTVSNAVFDVSIDTYIDIEKLNTVLKKIYTENEDANYLSIYYNNVKQKFYASTDEHNICDILLDIDGNFLGIGSECIVDAANKNMAVYELDLENGNYTKVATSDDIKRGYTYNQYASRDYDEYQYIPNYEPTSTRVVVHKDNENIVFDKRIFMDFIFVTDTSSIAQSGVGTKIYSGLITVNGELAFYKMEDRYIHTLTQLDATDINVYEKQFYGKNGVSKGTLLTNISLYGDDVNADMYQKIKDFYNNAESVVIKDKWRAPENINVIPVRNDGTTVWDISSVTDMSQMFKRCKNLKYIPKLNTSSVTIMYNAFNDCSNLEEVSKLDTSSVNSMVSTFSGCSNLSIVPEFNTENVTHMQFTFSSCSNLSDIPILNTSNVINMQYMFDECPSLSDTSLDNILAMCSNSQVTDKTLKYIGLTQEQAQRCKELSNWQTFVDAGWKTGYDDLDLDIELPIT